MKGYTEEEIIIGIKNGDDRILRMFYDRNYKTIRKFISYNSGKEEDVEDIFQDALVLIFQKITNDSLVINCSIHTYFYAICKNLWWNKLRRLNKVIYDEHKIITSVDTEDVSSSFNYDEKIREGLYRKHFLKLNEGCRKILTLIFEGKSTKEIERISGYTEGNIRKKKFDCKKKLIEAIEKDPLYKEFAYPQNET
ncbi:sigma-70 family RNA polymerase sigma factor [Aquimarina sp. ERC-38]|uniref:RNA polymerase sigma factor n=1 Tax=Aquimarina sp. ERC-38 TaxID=2949996 RepID=UPI0022486DD2|nr:sigma-70 family RNA polymerase sigma factor [Aquimarina sp. ERC-38]UZO82576.1 sigma-70 family RNA polymerase sigma factor [Aquimarina sp. ERC-38]